MDDHECRHAYTWRKNSNLYYRESCYGRVLSVDDSLLPQSFHVVSCSHFVSIVNKSTRLLRVL